MPRIKSITHRSILNSHVNLTNEFIVSFEDGSVGVASSPQGETISIYEDKKTTINPELIITKIHDDGMIGRDVNQQDFDVYLSKHISEFGRNNVYGLSEAFYNGSRTFKSVFELFEMEKVSLHAPSLCLNILNGGWHAYTNPVLSDFSEFMLVAKSNNIKETIEEHNEIQRVVRETQLSQTKTVVSGNPVNCFSTRDNREVIEFLLTIIEKLGISDKYELMIDASAGDLWNGKGYLFGVTNNNFYTSQEFITYWMDLIKQYKLRFLEDPFHEKDFDSWNLITTKQNFSTIIGDNLYSSDAGRILEGAKKKYAHAAVIKPNQAGTVSAVTNAIKTAQKVGHIIITSHRSISTESTFISLLTCLFGIKYIKIGPLMTDYSSVVRLNEIIRLVEGINGN